MIPYAIEVEGQIISMADSTVHEQVEFDGLDADPRWMICKRPFVAAGGELFEAGSTTRTGGVTLLKNRVTGVVDLGGVPQLPAEQGAPGEWSEMGQGMVEATR